MDDSKTKKNFFGFQTLIRTTNTSIQEDNRVTGIHRKIVCVDQGHRAFHIVILHSKVYHPS